MVSFFRKLLRSEFIPFSISLNPGLLLYTKQNLIHDTFPFNAKSLHYLYSGTAAIYQAAKAQGWDKEDEVLCPAFNCGHEIEPLLRAGVSVSCYTVGKDLQIDLESLENTITSRTRAVLIIHYFGFPQPIREIRKICDNKGVLLIEDCAHALFSKNGEETIGNTGDLAIFSLRKTLPLPEGGALLINNPGLEASLKLSSGSGISTWTKTLELIKKSLFLDSVRQGSILSCLASVMLIPLIRIIQFAAEKGIIGTEGYYDPDDEQLDFDTRILSWTMSNNSQKIIDNINPDEIVEKRRANFSMLSSLVSEIKRCQSIYKDLPEGICPLYYPLLVYNRDELIFALQEQNIFAAPWWEYFHPDVAWDDFPEAVFLKDHMIVLPVHQDIDVTQIKKMAEELRKYCN